ncbi:MAG TPA: YibE/F family protein [Candidatus Paceibacterota bacterium]|nr:YibE/F family protein [Candidatus Paceibacterota bacterium]
MKKFSSILFFLLIFCPLVFVHAQDISPTPVKARVTEVLFSGTQNLSGTSAKTIEQNLEAVLLDGANTGQTVEVQNDYALLHIGDEFYAVLSPDQASGDTYIVQDAYRLPALAWLGMFFVLCVFIFGGWQGIRGLLSLATSIALIAFVLLPAILHGYSPIWMSILIASFIIIIGSYLTHGISRTTTSAVIGMICAVLVSGFIAFITIQGAHLTGLGTEEAAYLNISTNGTIDFAGLLLGGMIIGFLGVLYDAAIGQAVVVEELLRAGVHMSKREIFWRAIRVGREHIGALVNTLAIAYVGASLPLLLLFYTYNTGGIAMTLNKEIFATEIARAFVGSIGLILAVPLTTLIAIFLCRVGDSSPEENKVVHHHHH